MLRLKKRTNLVIELVVTSTSYNVENGKYRIGIRSASALCIVKLREQRRISLKKYKYSKRLSHLVNVNAERAFEVVEEGSVPTFRTVNSHGTPYFNKVPRKFKQMYSCRI